MPPLACPKPILYCGIDNISDEEKVKITNQNKERNTRNLRGKPKSGKITESHTNPLFHREITGKMKDNLTAALYNSTQFLSSTPTYDASPLI